MTKRAVNRLCQCQMSVGPTFKAKILQRLYYCITALPSECTQARLDVRNEGLKQLETECAIFATISEYVNILGIPEESHDVDLFLLRDMTKECIR